MKGQGKRKRERIIVAGTSACLLLVLAVVYLLFPSVGQNEEWEGRIDRFDQYYEDFVALLHAVEEYAPEQGGVTLSLDKYEPVLYTADNEAVLLDKAETASLQNIQNLFCEENGFLGSITIMKDQVVFNNINQRYGVLFIQDDICPAEIAGERVSSIKIRPQWYHIAYS